MRELIGTDANTEIPCRMDGYPAVMTTMPAVYAHTPAIPDTTYTDRTAEEALVTPVITGATETHKDGCHLHQHAETSMSV